MSICLCTCIHIYYILMDGIFLPNQTFKWIILQIGDESFIQLDEWIISSTSYFISNVNWHHIPPKVIASQASL